MTNTSDAREHVYRVTEIVKITDGDTYWLRVDVGFRQTILVDVRLAGFDAPETNSHDDVERVAATAAKGVADAYLRTALDAEDLWVRTEPDPDSFGRWLGHVHAGDKPEDDLGRRLEAKQLATEWPTRWHEVYRPR